MKWNGEEIDTYYKLANIKHNKEYNCIDKKEDLVVEITMYKENYRQDIILHYKLKTFFYNTLLSKGAFWLIDNNNIAYYGFFTDIKEEIKGNTSILYLTFTNLYPYTFTYKFFDKIILPKRSVTDIVTKKFIEKNDFLLIAEFELSEYGTSYIKFKNSNQSTSSGFLINYLTEGYINSIKDCIYPKEINLNGENRKTKINENFLNELYVDDGSYKGITLINAHLFIKN